jgi:shikimate dehydrogenase
MIKLALIGKNIQHSKSPEIYQELMSKKIQYDLLDFQKSSDIPSAAELLLKYDGISITSPYKKHFLSEITLTNEVNLLGAINCLRIKNGVIAGENTDYLAIIEIVNEWIKIHKHLNIIILGDGVMSNVTQLALRKSNAQSFKVYSRKTTNNFDQLNVMEIFQTEFSTAGQNIIINTCSREYVFKGILDEKTIFWDYNYNLDQHSQYFSSKNSNYIDGLSLLKLQAHYALAFWSINNDLFK